MPSGVKFVLTAEPGTPDLDNVLHGIYELYSDYVLKVGVPPMPCHHLTSAYESGLRARIVSTSWKAVPPPPHSLVHTHSPGTMPPVQLASRLDDSIALPPASPALWCLHP